MRYLAAISPSLLVAAAILGCGGTVDTGGGGSGAGGHSSTSTTTGTSNTSTTGTNTATTGTGTVSTSTTGTGMGCGTCDFTCCGAGCVNTKNDIHNCGICGNSCTGPNPYCDQGKCGKPPCSGSTCGAGGECCGSLCCTSGQLCCTVEGPVVTTMCFAPTMGGTCPTGCKACVCTSPNTPIATPTGDRPIASLKEGDLVYSMDHGRLVAVAVRQTISVAAPDHVVVQVTLAGGRVLEISPRHPTADGRTFAQLVSGGTLDGVTILDVRAIPYAHERTHDILPDSDSGTYFAGGVLIGSTLAPNAARLDGPTAPMSAQ